MYEDAGQPGGTSGGRGGAAAVVGNDEGIATRHPQFGYRKRVAGRRRRVDRGTGMHAAQHLAVCEIERAALGCRVDGGVVMLSRSARSCSVVIVRHAVSRSICRPTGMEQRVGQRIMLRNQKQRDQGRAQPAHAQQESQVGRKIHCRFFYLPIATALVMR